MATKVLLFLSKLGNSSEQLYDCPDGTKVKGSQTNEAPVKYLLQRWPEISEILCIVTPEAEDALEWFRLEIEKLPPQPVIREIPCREPGDFMTGSLPEILAQFSQGDKLLLETTGGLRDAVMELLLVSRVLSYIGVQTVGAVYSNYQLKRIEYVTYLIEMFDLTGGMQEFTSFGSTRTLRQYYGSPAEDTSVEALLCAFESLLDSITLCRTNLLDAQLQTLERALADAESCEDPLLRAMLPAFSKKFGKNLNIPALIRWCVKNDMLQQALTIYKERIPAYLLNERSDLFTIGRGASDGNPKEYQSPEEAKFVQQFYDMGYATSDYHRMKDYYDEDIRLPLALEYLTQERLGRFQIMLAPTCPFPKSKTIFFDYFYIRTLRNMTNHANDETNAALLERVLTDNGYPRFDTLTAKDVKQLLTDALDHLRKEN